MLSAVEYKLKSVANTSYLLRIFLISLKRLKGTCKGYRKTITLKVKTIKGKRKVFYDMHCKTHDTFYI